MKVKNLLGKNDISAFSELPKGTCLHKHYKVAMLL